MIVLLLNEVVVCLIGDLYWGCESFVIKLGGFDWIFYMNSFFLWFFMVR